jgi:imidazolonepropionase-like amidohydrolase
VLLEATGRAAAFLDPHAEFGTIEPGKLADLLLVRGNPLEQISSTRDIAQVYLRGVAVERTPPALSR